MDTDQINKYLEKRIPYFVGTFAKNVIPVVTERPAMFVVNTHLASQPGEHWVAIHLINKTKGEYFDSFGFPAIEPEIMTYMNTHCRQWVYSSRTVQHPLARTCGVFACWFLLHRSTGLSYNRFREVFGTDLDDNETRVVRFFKSV